MKSASRHQHWDPSVKCKWDFFLAHAGKDTETAETLYELLIPHSGVFLDSRTLKLGDDWDVALAEGQRQSLITVVLVSSHTDRAYYQREEVAAAIQLSREHPDSHRVVPIYVTEDSGYPPSTPYGLQLKHGIKVDAQSTIQVCADRLLQLLKDLRRRGPAEKPRTARSSVVDPISSKRYSEIQRKAYAELWPQVQKLFDREARNSAQVTFSERDRGQAHHNELAEPGYELISTLDRLAPFLNAQHYERLRQIATDFCNYHVGRRVEYSSEDCTDPDAWTKARGAAWGTLYFDKRAEAERLFREVISSAS